MVTESWLPLRNFSFQSLHASQLLTWIPSSAIWSTQQLKWRMGNRARCCLPSPFMLILLQGCEEESPFLEFFPDWNWMRLLTRWATQALTLFDFSSPVLTRFSPDLPCEEATVIARLTEMWFTATWTQSYQLLPWITVFRLPFPQPWGVSPQASAVALSQEITSLLLNWKLSARFHWSFLQSKPRSRCRYLWEQT